MTQYRKTENTLSLLAGAALGAVAMYLLDPEAGRRRREHLGDTATDALEGASGAVGPLWERLSDTARSVADKAGGYGTALGAAAATFAERARERARDAASGASDSLSGLTDRAGEYTSGAREGVSDWWHDSRRRAGHWISGEEEESHAGQVAGITAGAIGALAVGAGLMYLFDPQRGRGRRAQLADQTCAILRQTGTTFSRLGRDVANRAYGMAAETRGTVQDHLGYGEEASAEKLLQRVRSEMGRATSHPSMIQVMTDNHGRVTLTGSVLAGESDAVVSAVRGVRGVTEVCNLLEVATSEQEMNRAAGAAGTFGGSTTGGGAGLSDTPGTERQTSQSVPPM